MMSKPVLSQLSVVTNVILLGCLLFLLIRVAPWRQSAAAAQVVTDKSSQVPSSETRPDSTSFAPTNNAGQPDLTLPPPPTMTPVPVATATATPQALPIVVNEEAINLVSAESKPGIEATEQPDTVLATEAATTAETNADDIDTIENMGLAELDWLGYLNAFRQQANLDTVSEDTKLTDYAKLHSNYMVQEDAIEHDEDEISQWYTDEGLFAAKSSNIVASSGSDSTFNWAIDYWISAPFHAIPLLNPALESVGFSTHNEEVGSLNMASVIDIANGVDTAALVDDAYPIMFPGDGGKTWIIRSTLSEWPNPLSACPGYERPVGAPIILMLGGHNQPPIVTEHRVTTADGTELEHCLFDETSYVNENSYQQQVGRGILDKHNAIVIMTEYPLQVGETYHVEVSVDGKLYEWSFSTVNSGFFVE
ncbi:MAG: CAP domain-containing protein [Anaerolineae bacterium]|nr:CAP domain-containing protein [Anaerolineae bacterium]